MPPKKTRKDLQSSPVYTMAHEEQVRLLSDALLREYMHRRGFLDTLKAFDEENPRDGDTISSRALMSDMMALQTSDQTRLKAEGIETIMEMLIDLRVEKRLEVETLREELERPIPAVPAEYIAAKTSLDKRKLKKREQDPHGAANSASDEDDDDNDTDGDDHEAELRRKEKKKKKKEKKSKQSKKGGADGDNDDDDGDGYDDEVNQRERERKSSKKKKEKKKKRSSAQEARPLLPGEAPPTMTMDDLLASGGDSDSSDERRPRSDGEDDDGGGSEDEDGGGAGGGHRRTSQGRSSQERQYLKSVDAPAWLREAATGRADTTRGAHGAAANAAEEDADVEEDAFDFADETFVELSPSVLEGSERLAAEAARAACRVLLGPHVVTPPASFLRQGFVFDDLLEFALIQWHRGPGAVLAPVQALVAAFFYEKERYVGVQGRQREALQRALCTVLFKAQPDPRNVCLVDGRFSKFDPCRGFLLRMTQHFRAWTGFDNRSEVESKVAELIEHHWSEDKDAGLWCFLVSTVLSRGAAAVASDMESSHGGVGASAGTSPVDVVSTLIDDKSGDGTEALVNLCLTGRAVCFHHDGTAPGKDGRLLRGYTSSVGCGLLDGDVRQHPLFADGTIEKLTFRYASSPTFASWVVSHAGHYSNLFMVKDGRKTLEQKRALGGKVSAELVYWDALTDDEEVKLTVTVDTAQSLGLGGEATSAARQGSASYVNRALLQVPDWSMGVVDWNGAKVIRG